MRPPRALRVAGYDVPVTVETNPDFTDEYHGQYSRLPTTRIRLSAVNEPSRQKETLIHELIHAISDAYDSELDERQVSTLSRGLYAAFVDNPKLLAYLAE